MHETAALPTAVSEVDRFSPWWLPWSLRGKLFAGHGLLESARNPGGRRSERASLSG